MGSYGGCRALGASWPSILVFALELACCGAHPIIVYSTTRGVLGSQTQKYSLDQTYFKKCIESAFCVVQNSDQTYCLPRFHFIRL